MQRLGGDVTHTPSERSEDQTFAGIFWAYDGRPSLCAPPRLYNQIALQIAEQRGLGTPVEVARYFALVNTAMADAGIAIWESKYFYGYWRPVTGIREADEGTGPTGQGDGNPGTTGDPDFWPLGAPASNPVGPNVATNFTPPFPAYPSGHAGFGGALFQTLRRFYGTDEIPFTFVSDEFNGETLDNQGQPAAADPAQLRVLVGSRGGERPEPHLSGHPLELRQDGGHRPGTARGGRGVPECVRAGAPGGFALACFTADAVLWADPDGPGHAGRRADRRGGHP